MWIINMRSRLFKQAVGLHLPQHLGLYLLATPVLAMQIKQHKNTPVTFYWIAWANTGSWFLCSYVAQFSFQIHHVLGDAVTPPCIWCSTNWAGTQCCGKWEIRLLLESCSAKLKIQASASLLGTDLQECFESMVAFGWCEINRKLGQKAWRSDIGS